MPRLGWLVCCVLLCLLPRAGAAAPIAATDRVPVPDARAVLVLDLASGQPLYAHNARTPLPVASTTKIMTALLALEEGNLGDVVTVGPAAAATGEASIWLEEGEQHSLHSLLLATLLHSANDAAVAIAEHLAGSEEAFARRMTERAHELGATTTNFVGASGLDAPGHYSTAWDLALITRHALADPRFAAMVATEDLALPPSPSGVDRSGIFNRNQFLYLFEGATGVKNGWTDAAGLTLVASARRDGRELLAVVLGAQSRIFTQTAELTEWAFAQPPPAATPATPLADPISPAAPAAPPQPAATSDAPAAALPDPPAERRPWTAWALLGIAAVALVMQRPLLRRRRRRRLPYVHRSHWRA